MNKAHQDRSWVEVSLDQLEKNISILKRQLTGSQRIMAVVKADAYGHGDIQVSEVLQEVGITDFAVSNIDEAIRLREAGIQGQILILGYTAVERASELLEYDITQALLSEEYAERLSNPGLSIKCQFAIDTGMNRIGLDAENVDTCERIIRSYAEHFQLTGLFTHLCVADTDAGDQFTEQQISVFKQVVTAVKDLNLPYCHFLNSAGGLWHKDASSDLVRFGIVMYGLKPDYSNMLPGGIKPILSWKSVVGMVKEIHEGETVGYGRTFRADHRMTIATIPTGYADGYPRMLSNKGWVLIRGKRAPIVGRVCMDQFMVDVTDIPDVRMGIETVLIGCSGDETITADDIANLIGTIGYEITCGISKRVPRIYENRSKNVNKIIEAVKKHASEKPDHIAYKVFDEVPDDEFAVDELTWAELDMYSDRLAGYIKAHTKKNEPIVVYGHKNKLIMVCFMACVKSGHAYCPVDVSVPLNRVQDIVDSVDPEVVLTTEDLAISIPEHCHVLDKEMIFSISNDVEQEIADYTTYLHPEDTFYIIFTSGSTGKPKGVQITTECLINYVEWAQNLGGGGYSQHEYRFLNQAPFSFDLSVMDVYLSLYTGGTICAITKNVQKNLRVLYKVLPETDVNVWVSTPSFADVCLSDRSFNNTLLPNLKYFLFCGEILTNKTAEKLRDAFPGSVVVNTYGPTESTVCITEVVIDDGILNRYSPLPVGAARPGTWLYIIDENGKELLEGEQGEIIIVGDTVSTGYFRNEEQTRKVFSTKEIDGTEYRLYHTGDKGYLKDGQLFYCGRIDFQIKLHGYRIEIEDIENNLVKVDGVEKAVVLPKYKNDQVQSLTAYLVYEGENENEFETAQKIKAELKNYVPEYMVPKKIVFRDALPMTINGKVDRKALGGLES